jgi:hypothetical protein
MRRHTIFLIVPFLAAAVLSTASTQDTIIAEARGPTPPVTMVPGTPEEGESVGKGTEGSAGTATEATEEYVIAEEVLGRDESEGLQLSVQERTIHAGSPVELHWEIFPNDLSSVSIVLGVILPDGSHQQYCGPREAFKPLKSLYTATPIMKNFPYNTAMRGVLSIPTPKDWPKGTYQFIAAVMQGKTVVELVYSNSFGVE